MTARTKRASRVARDLDSCPLRTDALREAFEDFRMFGELPDNERLAQAVLKSAIAGELQPVEEHRDQASLLRHILAAQKAEEDQPPRERTLREYLLDHAAYAPPDLRMPARLACQVLAAQGHDLTDPKTLADAPLPGHNGIGMHVLGYPEKLAVAPYAKQARRLFKRLAALRERLPQDDEEWFERAGNASMALRATGELPGDEVTREAVLADYEMECLMRHRLGQDVGELMAALDKAARGKGKARQGAIDEVARLVVTRQAQ